MRKLLLTASTLIALAVTPAAAADLPARAPVYKAPPAAVSNWTGFYAGLNAGYGWGAPATNLVGIDPILFITAQSPFGVLPTSLSPKMNGFVGGGQIGYNWQLDSAVVGLEADLAYSGMKGTATFSSNTFPFAPMTTTQTNEVTWLGTLRPRAGWLVTPSTLLFATGGLAYGGVKASTNVNVDVAGTCPAGNGFCAGGSISQTRVGWTAGGGIETLLGAGWSAKAEYLYFDLGTASYSVISTATFGIGGNQAMRTDARFNGNIVRIGVNYKFN